MKTVDCVVYEENDELMVKRPDGIVRRIDFVTGLSYFVGFVYDSIYGDELCPMPRMYRNIDWNYNMLIHNKSASPINLLMLPHSVRFLVNKPSEDELKMNRVDIKEVT